MNVALVYTENDIWAFGLRHLSAALKQAGHHTKIIVLKGGENGAASRTLMESLEEIVGDCPIIGVGSFSLTSKVAEHVCESLRGGDRTVVWGGIHATMNPAGCARHADVVCVGEGEGFLLDLVRVTESGGSWKDLPNAAFWDDGQFVQNAVRPLIRCLDDLPMPDFTFDNEYHLVGGRLKRVDKIQDQTLAVMFSGTRGCAFSCNYCSNSQLRALYRGKGRYVRKLNPERYVRDLESVLLSFPGSKYVNMVDEDFFSRPVAEIARFALHYRKHIAIPFECMGSPRNVTKEKVELLVSAGLWRINMGVESGSERTKQEVYNRHITNREVVEASRVLAGFPDVILNCFIIVGNPYEKKSDLLQTIDLFRQMRAPFYLTIYNLVFFPGTPLYRMAIADQIIGGKEESGYDLNALSGFLWQQHDWKLKNLYLNGLVYLMMGKVTAFRMGVIPRRILGLLVRPAAVSFNDKHHQIIKFMIFAKRRMWRMRSAVIGQLKRFLPNPAALCRNLSSALQPRSPAK